MLSPLLLLLLWLWFRLVGGYDGLCNEVRSSCCLPGNEYHEVLQQPLRALEEELLPVSTMGFHGKITTASMKNDA